VGLASELKRWDLIKGGGTSSLSHPIPFSPQLLEGLASSSTMPMCPEGSYEGGGGVGWMIQGQGVSWWCLLINLPVGQRYKSDC